MRVAEVLLRTDWHKTEKAAIREFRKRLKSCPAHKKGNAGALLSATFLWTGLHGYRISWHQGDWQAVDVI